MNKRRDQLKAMMAPILPGDRPEEERRTPVASGSLKAMGLTLKNLSQEADEARVLRAQLAAGAQVVDLDPGLVEPSFIRDRLEMGEGEAFDAFKASLETDGQQVPILVRPHPTQEGRYQAAYGHRRVAALRALGRPVKAIVRELSDEQLIIAQGKENSDRRDLSFIERALFAARLEDRGFSRAALMAALSLHKGNLSTMISLARELPEELITAIGAAPKIGRPRWEQLSQEVKRTGDRWRAAIADAGFAAASSDVRFERVLKALVSPPAQRVAEVITAPHGGPLARVDRARTQTRLTLDERQTPDFARYLIEHLPEIHAAFLRRDKA